LLLDRSKGFDSQWIGLISGIISPFSARAVDTVDDGLELSMALQVDAQRTQTASSAASAQGARRSKPGLSHKHFTSMYSSQASGTVSSHVSRLRPARSSDREPRAGVLRPRPSAGMGRYWAADAKCTRRPSPRDLATSLPSSEYHAWTRESSVGAVSAQPDDRRMFNVLM
jgi:hypothetical protein